MTAPSQVAEGFAGRSFTVSDILRMVEAGVISEDANFELIEGEIVPMSPKGNQHEVIKSALTEYSPKHKPDDLRLGVETSLYLADDTFVEPDLCLYPRRILPEDVRGVDVLLAIEVAASSLSYDRGRKARVYARHQVRELWVIDAVRRVTWVHKQPSADGSWGTRAQFGPDALLVPDALPGLGIRVSELD